MGSGSWTKSSYNAYTTTTRGMSSADYATSNLNVQQVYKTYGLSPVLNPKGVTRLCHDSEEHPNSMPVILGLDVTGSMGGASVEVSKKLGEIMETLYNDSEIKDIEFCIMGIGDLSCDCAPVQMSQFESDIRIAEQLDKIYFEAGGGGNTYESYTAAWYMGTRHTDLDCLKRGKKALIITMGDEAPNPYLPADRIKEFIGDSLQGDVETSELYKEAIEKFNIYHISVNDHESSYNFHQRYHNIDDKWKKLLGENYKVATLQNLAKTITDIIKQHMREETNSFVSAETSFAGLQVNENGEVVW